MTGTESPSRLPLSSSLAHGKLAQTGQSCSAATHAPTLETALSVLSKACQWREAVASSQGQRQQTLCPTSSPLGLRVARCQSGWRSNPHPQVSSRPQGYAKNPSPDPPEPAATCSFSWA